MNVKIVLEVSEQSPEAHALVAFFASLAGASMSIASPAIQETAKTAKPVARNPKEVPAPAAKTEPAVSAPEVEAPAETEAPPAPAGETQPEIKVEDVRALLQKKAEGNRAAIKSKLTEYKANNVSTLDKADYPAFVEFLNTLK